MPLDEEDNKSIDNDKKPRKRLRYEEQIGAGSFGRILVDPEDNSRAIKVIELVDCNGELQDCNVREVAILKLLGKIDGLVEISSVDISKKHKVIRMSMPRASLDLHNWCKSKTFIERMSCAQEILAQTASALHSLHKAGVIHGDLKPANILVFTNNDEFTIKIADLGSCSLISGMLESTRCTHSFCPPEGFGVFPPNDYDARAFDAFSLGAVLYFLIYKKYLFVPPPPSLSYEDALERVRRIHQRGHVAELLSMTYMAPGVPLDVYNAMIALLSPDYASRGNISSLIPADHAKKNGLLDIGEFLCKSDPPELSVKVNKKIDALCAKWNKCAKVATFAKNLYTMLSSASTPNVCVALAECMVMRDTSYATSLGAKRGKVAEHIGTALEQLWECEQ